jgi:hypothetical protein
MLILDQSLQKLSSGWIGPRVSAGRLSFRRYRRPQPGIIGSLVARPSDGSSSSDHRDFDKSARDHQHLLFATAHQARKHVPALRKERKTLKVFREATALRLAGLAPWPIWRSCGISPLAELWRPTQLSLARPSAIRSGPHCSGLHWTNSLNSFGSYVILEGSSEGQK